MPLTLRAGSITEQEDGTYTVVAIVERSEDGKILADKDFQARNTAELKTKVKQYFQTVVAIERRNISMKNAAQIVMDEVMNEVSQ